MVGGLGLPPLCKPGYPYVDDPGHPAWSLASAGWPGLTPEEAAAEFKRLVAENRRLED